MVIYDFLKNNSKHYKKVFLSDIDDVYMFKDIFSTFDEDEIIINNINPNINFIIKLPNFLLINNVINLNQKIAIYYFLLMSDGLYKVSKQKIIILLKI